MGREWVAVSTIRHGEGDAGQKTFSPGETVTGLAREVMFDLYSSGSLAEKGSRNDPNTWVVDDAVAPTTPRLVEDVLRRQQMEQLFGDVEDMTTTQPGGKAPEDPAALLTNPHAGENEEGEPVVQRPVAPAENPKGVRRGPSSPQEQRTVQQVQSPAGGTAHQKTQRQ